jgi:hypothetical protein
MKKLSLLVFVITCFMTATAMADRGDQYLLPKLGFMSINLNNAKPLFSGGLLYGYGISPSVTIEGEINVGISGGGYDRKDSSGQVYDSGNYKIWTLAAYGVYRLPIFDNAYLKGKLGGLYENIKRTSDFGNPDTATGFGLAGGVGVGVIAAKKLTFELEVTGIDADIIFYSLGIHYPF